MVVIPVFILSLCLNRFGENKVSYEVSKLLETKVEHCLKMMEKDVNHMMTFMQNYTINRNLLDLANKYSVMDYYERPYAINGISDDFDFYKSTFDYVENIKVYIRDIDRCISSSQNNKFFKPDKEWMDMILKSYRTKNVSKTYKVGNIISVSYFHAFSDDKDYIPMFIFQMELSNKGLKGLIDEYFAADYIGAMMTDSNSNWKICNDDMKISENVLDDLNNKYDIFNKKFNKFLSIKGKEYLVINDYSDVLGISLSVYIEKNRVMEYTKPFQIWYWVLLAIAVTIVALFSYWLFRLVYKPFNILMNSFRTTEDGQLDVKISNTLNDEFSYLYSYISDLVKKLNDTVKNYYEEKLIAQKNEMRFLQSQINPHFLYNSLFMLKNMLRMQDNENGFMLCKYLAEYFRFITKGWTDSISLENEVRHTANYINIQKFRYMDRFNIQLGDIPQGLSNIKVPRLILQPIIENSFKHGFTDTIKGGIISIDFIYDENYLIISVRDNGKGFDRQSLEYLEYAFEDNSDIDDITGMINVNRRLKLMYADNSGLKIMNNGNCGAEVDIILNFSER